MITIVNLKKYRGRNVYIGRPGALGNPFIVGRDGDRETVIRKYRRWLWEEIRRESGPVFQEIRRLAELSQTADLALGCWCSPEPCHGAVVKAAVEWFQQVKLS